jgi:hypothetical protein
MNPLFTILTVSPVVPPVNVRPGVDVLSDQRYTPLFTVTVISLCPARYPEIAVTSNVAFFVSVENTEDKVTLKLLP